MKWYVWAFAAFLLSIVALANAGHLSFFLSPGTGLSFLPIDKIGHFVLMGGMAFLVNLALGAKTFNFAEMKLLKGSFIVLIIVTMEEFSQMFLVHRTFSLGDLAADMLGIYLFGKLAVMVCRRSPGVRTMAHA